MKFILLTFILSCSLWAQSSTPKAAAPKPAPKAATPAAAAKQSAKAPAAKASTADLMKPATLKEKTPAIYVVRLETTKGNVVIRVQRDWAPQGAGRFYNLVKAGFYDNNYFFRTLDFITQFGIPSVPAIAKVWADQNLFDDRVVQSNKRGTVTFAAQSAPNTRSTQIFINKLDQNSYLDQMRFAPFGEVVEGMDVVDKLYAGYGGTPDQGMIINQGEVYITRYYPRLDKIIKATVIAVPQP